MRRLLLVAALVAPWTVNTAAATPRTFLSAERVGDRCWGVSTSAETALDCWLSTHPQVAAAMMYQDSQYNGIEGWPTWPAPAKQRLRLYFGQMVTWVHAGMPADTYPKPFPIHIPKQGPTIRCGASGSPSRWDSAFTCRRRPAVWRLN